MTDYQTFGPDGGNSPTVSVPVDEYERFKAWRKAGGNESTSSPSPPVSEPEYGEWTDAEKLQLLWDNSGLARKYTKDKEQPGDENAVSS